MIDRLIAEYRRAHGALRASLESTLADAGFELVRAAPGEDGAEWHLTVRPAAADHRAGAGAPMRGTPAVEAVTLPGSAGEPLHMEIVELEPGAERSRPGAADASWDAYSASPAGWMPDAETGSEDADATRAMAQAAPAVEGAAGGMSDLPLVEEAVAPRGPDPSDPTAQVGAVIAAEGEAFAAVLARGDRRLLLSLARGPGGVVIPPMSPAEQLETLAPTLVGDAFLDMRHRGADEGDEFAVAEVVKAFGIYRDEAERLVGACDPEAFVRALSEWVPAGSPVGRAFLQRMG